jgi:hypothetical protein
MSACCTVHTLVTVVEIEWKEKFKNKQSSLSRGPPGNGVQAIIMIMDHDRCYAIGKITTLIDEGSVL